MPTTNEYIGKIRAFNSKDLLLLWKSILSHQTTPEWDSGKAFEFLILRAFELEGAIVRWPYDVSLLEESVEQIDGVVHLRNGLSIVIECKDYSAKINIEPLAKIRNQLLRRPANTIGAVFTTSGFTEPALVLSRFIFPQTIILWERGNIEYCLQNSNFTEGMLLKYRHTVEECFPNFDLTTIT